MACCCRCCGVYERVGSYVDARVSEKRTISLFSPEDGYSVFLRNVGFYLRMYIHQNSQQHYHHPYRRESLKSHKCSAC